MGLINFLSTIRVGRASTFSVGFVFFIIRRWDEWVECSRIVEIDSDGLILQKKLATEYASTDSKATDKDDIDVIFHACYSFFF